MTATLNQVVQFLLGAGELEGCYFGDIPDGEKGPLWWRSRLRDAIGPILDTEFLELRRIRLGVAEFYRISPDALTAKSKSRGLAHARQMGYLLCRALTPCSTNEIGIAFGGRDTSTITKGIEAIRQRVNTDPELRKQYDHLKQKLEQRP